MQKCIICLKPTDKCCSLCRKVFYCSAQHQQFDWHTKHKAYCQGKKHQSSSGPSHPPRSNLGNQSQNFKIYDTSEIHSRMSHINQNPIVKNILRLIEQRFILRKNILTLYSRINKSHSKQYILDLIQQAKKLVKISQQICQTYKPSISIFLKQLHVNANQFILSTQLILDQVLLVRCYYAGDMRQQLNQLSLLISKNIKQYDIQMISKEDYKNTLLAILQAFECVKFDRGSQVVMGKYVRFIQQIQGIWQQIYSYYNLGIWYTEKTYYDKAVRTFQYVLQLLSSHKNHNDDTVLFRADACFNLGLARYLSHNNIEKSVQAMLQSYHLRVKGIGKNSLQAGDCLQHLARWTMSTKQWQNCLFYLQQCYRIKKQYDQDLQSIERVRNLVQTVYSQIYAQKAKNQEAVNPKTVKYYENLLQKHPSQIGQSQSKINKGNQETFAQKILKDDRQFIKFKVNVTPQMSDSYDSIQWQKLSDLMVFMDQRVEKSQAVKMLIESPFFNSLNQQQRKSFLDVNSI